MSALALHMKSFIADERGVSAMEYGLIAAAIAVAIAGTVGGLGEAIKTKLGAAKTAITTPPTT